MKRFISAIVIAMLVMVGTVSNVMAAATPRLLCPGLGDPNAMVFGDTVYFAGTDGNNIITIYSIPVANLGSTYPASYVSTVCTYNPSSFGVGTFTAVMGATPFNEPGGNIGLFFSADKNGLATSTYYAENLGAPQDINAGQTLYPHTSTSAWNGTKAQEMLKIRIDDEVFYDDVDNDGIDTTDPRWHIYVYFYNGNNVAVWKDQGTGSQTTAFDIQLGATCTDAIAEGGTIFKRGSYYYCIYSIGHWLGGYQLKYRRATTVAGLATASALTVTYKGDSIYDQGLCEYGYKKNSGAASVIKSGTTYYLIFHVGVPISGTYMFASVPNTSRATYIVPIAFSSDGYIPIITLP